MQNLSETDLSQDWPFNPRFSFCVDNSERFRCEL